MTEADLEFADTVRAAAGWNQTADDWRRFLATEPGGCFVAEWDGTRAGTATTTVYGVELAWIGMVLVHPEYRRRGIGRALLEGCLEALRARGVRCIKLDATPLGKRVYDGLGFRDEWTLRRWNHPDVRLPAQQTALADAPWVSSLEEAQQIGALDEAAFGVSRLGLLRALANSGSRARVLRLESGQVAGFGLSRPGARARYLGPVVAESPQAGLRLVEALLGEGDGQGVYWDIPDPNLAAVEWAQGHGFSVQRPLIRMYWGENRAPGDPRRQFALAGPEVG